MHHVSELLGELRFNKHTRVKLYWDKYYVQRKCERILFSHLKNMNDYLELQSDILIKKFLILEWFTE